jgi:hypothetical protein
MAATWVPQSERDPYRSSGRRTGPVGSLGGGMSLAGLCRETRLEGRITRAWTCPMAADEAESGVLSY